MPTTYYKSRPSALLPGRHQTEKILQHQKTCRTFAAAQLSSFPLSCFGRVPRNAVESNTETSNKVRMMMFMNDTTKKNVDNANVFKFMKGCETLTDPIGSLCNCIARAAVSSFANSTNACQAKSKSKNQRSKNTIKTESEDGNAQNS